MGTKKDLYNVLGVMPTASSKEIRQAYLRLAMLRHPDKDPSPRATAEMQEINEAFSILGNEHKRIKYNFEFINKEHFAPNNSSPTRQDMEEQDISSEVFRQISEVFSNALITLKEFISRKNRRATSQSRDTTENSPLTIKDVFDAIKITLIILVVIEVLLLLSWLLTTLGIIN